MHEEDRPGDMPTSWGAPCPQPWQSSDRGVSVSAKAICSGVRPDLALCWRAGVADSYGNTDACTKAASRKEVRPITGSPSALFLALAAICFWES